MPWSREPRHHRVAVDSRGQLDDVDEPRAHVVGVVRERRLDVDAGEQLVVDALRRARARLEDPVELLELADAECRREVVEAVVVTEAAVLQPARSLEPALVAQRDEQLVLVLVARRDGAALARRHLLVRIERPDGRMAVRAERLALVLRAERLARVLDHRDARAARRAGAARRTRPGSRRCRRRRSPSSAA